MQLLFCTIAFGIVFSCCYIEVTQYHRLIDVVQVGREMEFATSLCQPLCQTGLQPHVQNHEETIEQWEKVMGWKHILCQLLFCNSSAELLKQFPRHYD